MHPFLAANLAPQFRGKKVLLGITGSIAAFKAIDLIRLLKSLGAEVRVVPTENALQFVTATTLETLSGQPVITEMFGGAKTHHIDTARWADLALVAPATANFIAKMSHGLADDLLSTELLAFTGAGATAVVPAMNPAMFAHPATQASVATLKSWGVSVLGPTAGVTACGEEGLGRMLEPVDILKEWALALTPPAKPTRRAVITMGPTRSNLDPVRYLSNHSSGQMGAALAWEAFRRGFVVTAVAGPCEFAAPALLPPGSEVVAVTTAGEMAHAALSAWARSESTLFMATAAVLDWDVETASGKIKKTSETRPREATPRGATPQLHFKENRDILKEAVGARRPGCRVLGFAAETGELETRAAEKLLAKGCDYLFANDVSGGRVFNSTRNEGLFLTAETSATAPAMSKVELSTWIFDRMEVGGEAPAIHH